jgi:hypothetical protein
MAYVWNSLTFDPPAGLVDQTVVSFVDNAAEPTFTVTISQDARGSTAFAAYVDAQLADLPRALPGFAAVGTKKQQGNAVVVVEHKAQSPGGQPMRQKQAYVDGKDGNVAILTVTCADKPHAKADAAFDQMLKSLGAN